MLKVNNIIVVCLTIIIVATIITGNAIKVALVFAMYLLYKIYTHA